MDAADGLTPDDAAAAQELWLGPPAGGSQFRDRAALEAAWKRLRVFVMGEYAKLGRRPMCWWLLEASGLGLKYPGDDHEQSYLFEANVLPENERANLLVHWRTEFACGCALTDAKARRQYIADADIPKRLLREWMRTRRRRTKTIRRLVA